MSSEELVGVERLEKLEQLKQRIEIVHTREWYRDLKQALKMIFAFIGLALILYVIWLLWEWYFVVDFFVSLPFAFYIAFKILKKRYHNIVILDLGNNKFNVFRISKSYRLLGNYVTLVDNVGDNVVIAETMRVKKLTKEIQLNTRQVAIQDKLKFLIDSKIVDVVADKNAELSTKYYLLRKMFINKLLSLFRMVQEGNLLQVMQLLKAEIEKQAEAQPKASGEVVTIE